MTHDEYRLEYRQREAAVHEAERAMERILLEVTQLAAALHGGTAAAAGGGGGAATPLSSSSSSLAERARALAASLVGFYDQRAKAQLGMTRLEEVAAK